MRANKVPRHAVARAMTSRFRMAQAPTYADSLKRKKRIDALAQSYYHGGILNGRESEVPYGRGTLLAGGAGARDRLRWRVCVWRALDRYLLPSNLPFAAAAARA